MPETETPGNRIAQSHEQYIDEIIWPSVRTKRVVDAMSRVDRSLFAPMEIDEDLKGIIYSDYIIPLGDGSSLSQPSLVAEMIEHLDLHGWEKVLEVGTGSGYNAAVLSHLSSSVDTIDFDTSIVENAKRRLDVLGTYSKVHVHLGDGAQGLPENAPYDAIIVTAAVSQIPYQLEKQLAEGGRIIAPVGKSPIDLQLTVGLKRNHKLITKKVHSVMFHPLISKFHGGWDSYEEYDDAGRMASGQVQEISIPRAARYMARKLQIEEEKFLTVFESALSFEAMEEQEKYDKLRSLQLKTDALLVRAEKLIEQPTAKP